MPQFEITVTIQSMHAPRVLGCTGMAPEEAYRVGPFKAFSQVLEFPGFIYARNWARQNSLAFLTLWANRNGWTVSDTTNVRAKRVARNTALSIDVRVVEPKPQYNVI